MKFAHRALIAVALLIAAGHLRAQEPEPQNPPAVTPIPVVSPPPAIEASPEPEVTAAPAEPANAPPPAPVAEIPQSSAIAPIEAPAPVEAPAAATARTSSARGTRKPRETAREPKASPPSAELAHAPAATAAVAQTAHETLPTPAFEGSTATSPGADSAVPPVAVADQQPVVQPAPESVPAERRTGSTWLLIGGLALGVIGIATMIFRRRREDSISILEHAGPVPRRRDSAVPYHS